jgi:hypothetical protein
MPAASKAMKVAPVMKAMKAKKEDPPMTAMKKPSAAAAEPMITIGLSGPIHVDNMIMFTLMVKTSDTIEQLRRSISRRAGYQAAWILHHERVLLESGHTLRDYNIQEGDELAFDV